MRTRISSAVMTPLPIRSSCMARLMISHSEGGPSSGEWSCLWVIALAYLGHPCGELRFGEEAMLDEHHAHGVRGALEVAELQIAIAEVLGRAPQLIEAHDLAARQRVAQRVRLLLPELHAVIGRVDRAAGLAAHV